MFVCPLYTASRLLVPVTVLTASVEHTPAAGLSQRTPAEAAASDARQRARAAHRPDRAGRQAARSRARASRRGRARARPRPGARASQRQRPQGRRAGRNSAHRDAERAEQKSKDQCDEPASASPSRKNSAESEYVAGECFRQLGALGRDDRCSDKGVARIEMGTRASVSVDPDTLEGDQLSRGAKPLSSFLWGRTDVPPGRYDQRRRHHARSTSPRSPSPSGRAARRSRQAPPRAHHARIPRPHPARAYTASHTDHHGRVGCQPAPARPAKHCQAGSDGARDVGPAGTEGRRAPRCR